MSRFERAILDRFLEGLNARVEGFSPEIPGPAFPPEDRPVIWVVGAPRSGTTLVSEVLVRALGVGYVTNLAARFPGNPVAGLLLSETMRVHGGGARDLEFDIGKTRGPLGNHEFGMFWTRWLGLDRTADGSHRLGDAERAAVDLAGLSREIRAMIAAADLPFLFRNVICGLNAALLARAHPRSVFVEVRRDPAETVASILRCRRERGGGEDRWWSLRPSGWRRCVGDPVAQVARQVAEIRRDLASERARLEREGTGARWEVVRYEAFCGDPDRGTRRVAAAAGAVGEPPAVRGSAPAILEHRAAGVAERVREETARAFEEAGLPLE